ncbi:glycosyl hydrolase 108 family protein [Prevotella intermedia]|nr:glycosyl hydrolase 108 family protein [Prevotella intermedia]
MDKNSQEKKNRNRELIGESFEVIGDQALCMCSNGSKPSLLKVINQQKYNCNGGTRLIATIGERDTRSLNFGNCKVRNNSPCIAVIEWENFYDKILIGNSLYPLTMKSTGTCACGGKVTFKTSGQQVAVIPPNSMREAEQVVYAHPLLKKEDIKNVSTKEPEKKENPLKQFSKNAFVNSVRVNGNISISLNLYSNEPLIFTNTLTQGSDPSTSVKWDVTHNGKNIATALSEAPTRSMFSEEGEYKVFAYVKTRGSKKGGGYVTVTVSEPKFISLEWKDTNEKIARYIGKRNVVYAHTKFEGTRDIPVKARFYYRSLNGKEYLTDFAPLQIEQDGTTKVELSLTDTQAEEIKNMQTEKTLIYMELFSEEWIENSSLSEKTPIKYTDKEDITSIALYRDKDCKEVITEFIESGQTIYARVTTRGLDDSDIALIVCGHGTVKEEDTSINGTVYEISGETDSYGVAILEIKTDTGWLKETQSETFDIFVLEGGCKESVIIMPNGKSHTNRNTTKLFQMGKNRGILMLALPKQDIKPEQSKTMVQDIINNGCGGKYCITQHNYKQYNCGKLIQEINIRLAGFGGNVPTEEFDERTKKTIMQFQQDYMGVPPSGKICGSLLKAIDEFCTNKAYDFNFEQTKCPCGKCEGYGNGRNSFTINKKEYKGKEYPGMHRSLLFALKGLIFYLRKTKSNYSLNKIDSGYRCWDNNKQKGRTSTNHMGCALDLHFNINGSRTRNVKDMENIRSNYFCAYMNAPKNARQTYGFGWESERIGLEPKKFNNGKKGADTWVHFDVREFRKYKSDIFYIKSKTELIKSSMIDLANVLGLQKLCTCQIDYTSTKIELTDSETCKLCDLPKRECEERFKNKIMPIIFEHEGGYSDKKSDKGGKTNRGISWNIWKSFAKKDIGVEPTEENLRVLTKEQAIFIYKVEYWDAHKLCKIKDNMIALMVFDWTLTSGKSHREIQKLLNEKFKADLKVDNNIGSTTIDKINEIEDQKLLLDEIAIRRKKYYKSLVEKDPIQEINLKGWLNRVDDCLQRNI